MTRFLIVPIAAAAALSISASAHAQGLGRIDSNRPSYAAERQSYNDSRRAAYDNGYRDGARVGEQDGRRNAAFAYQNERTYQRADKGYHRSFGDIDRYRQSFRSGFAAGYSDGYQRYTRVRDDRGPRYGYGGGPIGGGYGRGGTFANPAFENGANDGYEKGVEDSRKNRSFDVLRHKWYREGDRHYESRYMPREQYKDIYREGFKEGYARGFRNFSVGRRY